MPVKVVIIESSDTLRQGLEAAFSADPFFYVVYSCNKFPEHWDRVSVSSPDIVLLDADLPENLVIEFMGAVVSTQPHAQVMIMVESEENSIICTGFRFGISGFQLKNTTVARVIEAAKDLYQGGAPMSPLIAKKLLNAFLQTIKGPIRTSNLSPREKEILMLLSEGLQYKEIASRLSISLYTVRQHLHNIYSKLEVQNKVEAINKGLAPE